MRVDKKLLIIMSTVIIVGGISAKTISAQAKAGSESDPLVSKSYVDNKIEELKKSVAGSGGGGKVLSEEEMSEIVTDVVAQLQFYNTGSVSSVASGSTFKPVEVKKGRVLVGKEGTEIILRTGSAFVYSKTENGVVDATVGKDLNNGAEVIKNHLMIVPRTDNRGVIPTTNCWFMVKGDYTIK